MLSVAQGTQRGTPNYSERRVQAEHGFQLSEGVVQYIEYIASFLSTGAIGFRYAAARDRHARSNAPTEDRGVYIRALRRAATIGLVAALILGAQFAMRLPDLATRRKLTIGGLLTADIATGAQAVLLAIGIIGLLLAAFGARTGWPLAAIGIIIAPLSPIFAAAWSRLINPVHVLVGGLWIGTLF